MALTNILLIDDDKDDQFFFIEDLGKDKNNIICHVADDSLNGLQFIKEKPHPKIIFLDLNMPQMNGFDFLEVVKNEKNVKHIPVVIYTSSNHHTDIKKAEEFKALGILTKPNKLTNISERLDKALGLQFFFYNRNYYNINQ